MSQRRTPEKLLWSREISDKGLKITLGGSSIADLHGVEISVKNNG